MQSKDDVCFFIYSLQESNGTERAVVNAANGLVSSGVNVEIISIVEQSNDCAFEIDCRVRQSSLMISAGQSKLFVYLALAWRVIFYEWHRLGHKRHVVGTLVYINLILIIAKIISIRCRSTLSVCEHVPYHHPHFVIRFIRKVLYRFADAVICLNSIEQSLFLGEGANAVVIPNIVNQPIQPNATIRRKSNRLLFVGRLSKEKGIDLFIDVVRYFFSLPNTKIYHIDIIGEGDLLDFINSSVAELGLSENVHVLGRINNVHEHYQSHDLLLMTSRYESFGMVIIESMLCGTPVIAFNVESGPATLIKNGHNGFLVTPFDCKSYALSVYNIVVNCSDSLAAISENCRKDGLAFSVDNIIPLWIKHLNLYSNR